MKSGLIGLLLQGTDFEGDLRLIGTLPPDFAVDADGTMVGQDFVVDSRLRSGLTIDMDTWSFVGQGDFLTGQILGDPWDLEGDIHRRHLGEVGLLSAEPFVPRKAYIEGNLKSVQILAGLTTAQWGLGMVANSGETQPTFGRNDYGDRLVRLQLKTALNKFLFVAISGDAVIEDDMASYRDGQRAWQSSNALISKPSEGHHVGMLFVYRWQQEANEARTTNGYFLDLNGGHKFDVKGYELSIAYEAALIQGDTSRFSNYNYPYRLGLISKGVAAELAFTAPEEKWGFLTKAGFASGDGDPDDGTIRDFSFDRDYNAGMLLYDYYQGGIEVGQYNQLTDPDNSGYPPHGVEAAVTEGAIRKSTFVQPSFYAKPLPWLTLKTGLLIAWSTAPISNGFNTFRNGGVPVNHLGERTEGYHLGNELNWGIGVDGSQLVEQKWAPSVELQGGHLWTSSDYGSDEMLSMIALQGNFRF